MRGHVVGGGGDAVKGTEGWLGLPRHIPHWEEDHCRYCDEDFPCATAKAQGYVPGKGWPE